ncbi:hypothetical protein THASP1DRAFT_33503 [Thamnocephalis sphaerospora]|uniref:SGNH hydrolase-type esterase domain-containing protein n=1 Tax=Thamnocephalis sphaerospora TaxID=78915 RepID=A0A4P9XGE3_9FUNG|nr:hypothetical protein THASP1DRAFT_33503 [Thamnocephalis sphaerospora]|eukprot:RKP04696.1 hypothetical protein THASP1DRAFT_33503 [Thamnocephalis sphaerospora]
MAFNDGSINSLAQLWAALCHYLYLFRLWYIRWMLDPRPRNDPREHTILIVGDSNAYGYGDNWKASTPGIAGYIERAARAESSVRQIWRAVNRGVFGSTSATWAPQQGSAEGSVSLIEKTLQDPRAREAEIAIVLLGSEDGRTMLSPEATMTNLRAVCEILGQQGSRLVYLVNIPTMSASLDGAEQAGNVLRNDLIQEYLKT